MTRRVTGFLAVVARTRNVAGAVGAGALALSLAACNGAESPAAATFPVTGVTGGTQGSTGATEASPLVGTWKLVGLQQDGQAAQAAPAGTFFSAEFTSDSRVHAVVDCNRCGGGYSVSEDSLTIGAMACTRAYCVASAPFDSAYEKLLSGAKGWSVKGTSLEIRSEGGVLRFER